LEVSACEDVQAYVWASDEAVSCRAFNGLVMHGKGVSGVLGLLYNT
jgi:hypothetical protein